MDKTFKQEFKNVLLNTTKHFCYILSAVILTVGIAVFSLLFQIFDSTVYNFVGKRLWLIIYFGLPVIVIVISFIAKYIKKFSFKKAYIFSGISILIYVAIAFGTYEGVYIYFKDFTPQKWAEHPTERYHMVKDLNEKYTLIGMPGEELTELLGESEGCYASPDNDNELIEYRIGYFSIDPTQLSFELKDGKVIDVYVYTEFRHPRKSIEEFSQ